ncbi:hypothetical protein GCM10011571_09590 [Marinithermofilum abyssi]|uniref:Small integral membrane protein n=1 Tax=Marinithermofilum abyssi TaxID=1571185 RepID=A0A8J2VEP3_9BACL|nr:DUF2273 domain-containing protein [Marinithermofilum abyssi]GGE10370.1 hypothetical protein GCM10011571_09590 [Marinithermofilum abyssi]
MLDRLWETHRGRVVGTVVGFVLGLIYLIVGFWKTMVFGLFVGVGFWIGHRMDRRDDVGEVLENIFPDKWFRKS